MNAGSPGVDAIPPVTAPGASAEEIAAVLAALTRRGPGRRTVADPYERWRRTRLAATAMTRSDRTGGGASTDVTIQGS